MLRRTVVMLAVGASLGCLPAAALADSCPNEQLRAENSSLSLPDCRAYEMVSPVDKNSGEVLGAQAESSESGEAVTYDSFSIFSDAQGAGARDQYVSRRGPDGWSTTNVSPIEAARPADIINSSVYNVFSPELTSGVLVNDDPLTPLLSPEALPGYPNYYKRDLESGAYTLLVPKPQSSPPPISLSGSFIPHVAAATPDLGHVVYNMDRELVAGAPSGSNEEGHPSNAYEWSDGHVRLVSILPDGSDAPEGGDIGSTCGVLPLGCGLPQRTLHAISDDGSRVFFWTPHPDGQLYVREDGAVTRRVSAPQGFTDPAGTQPAYFQDASSDGRYVFFTSLQKLNPEAGLQGGSSSNLYRYDVVSGRLLDVSLDLADSEGAQVTGVVDSSRSGEVVYFVARGRLVAGQGAAGQPNLYMWRAGVGVTFVAGTEAATGPRAHEESAADPPEQITPDGSRLLFSSSSRLTSYDNDGYLEVYLYDADSDHLTCVSCDPSGASPVSNAELSDLRLGSADSLAPRNSLSSDGQRVFFITGDSLVPADVNRATDVYEWDAGVVSLISTGRGAESTFIAASPSGDDVFFVTDQRLTSGDRDSNADVYDARVKGGFPRVEAQSDCQGEACQGQSSGAPALPYAATTGLSGQGNLTTSPTSPTVKKKSTVKKKRAQKKPTKKKKAAKKKVKRRKASKKATHGKTAGRQAKQHAARAHKGRK